MRATSACTAARRKGANFNSCKTDDATFSDVSGALTSLNIAGHPFAPGDIGPEGAKAIADALHVNSALTKLNLVDNKIGAEANGRAAVHEIAEGRP
jgi:hypothetical protein